MTSIVTFKPKGSTKKIEITLATRFELSKWQLRKPSNKHKYDYTIEIDDKVYNLYPKTYKHIVNRFNSFCNTKIPVEKIEVALPKSYSYSYVYTIEECKLRDLYVLNIVASCI